MPKSPKSPQEKKELALKRDRITFSKSVPGFRKTWPKKKALANREYRRKSDELLTKTKTGDSAEDAEIKVGDVTTTHLKKSISRKRLVKWGPVSLGEAIKLKLEKREETVGRRANKKHRVDSQVASVLSTLEDLDSDALKAFLIKLDAVLRGGDTLKSFQLSQSPDPLVQAIFFVKQIARGNAIYCDSLERNREFCVRYRAWRQKAVRVMEKMRRPAQRKLEEKAVHQKKVKAQLRKLR